MTVLINIQAEIIVLIVLNIIHTVPSLLLVIIYLKIFRAAHTSSERARRNSAMRLVVLADILERKSLDISVRAWLPFTSLNST